jgi:hypothetical protein
MGLSSSVPVVDAAFPRPSKTSITQETVEQIRRRCGIGRGGLGENALMLTSNYLPVLDLPTLQGETCVGDGRWMFSIRGTDDVMFHAYFGNFIKTWGDYVCIREPPSRLRDGDWSVIGWTTKEVWTVWFGKRQY